jgi:hypothetical protein
MLQGVMNHIDQYTLQFLWNTCYVKGAAFETNILAARKLKILDYGLHKRGDMKLSRLSNRALRLREFKELVHHRIESRTLGINLIGRFLQKWFVIKVLLANNLRIA